MAATPAEPLLAGPAGVVPENARSVANLPLPPPPPTPPGWRGKPPVTLVLFYQYVEPMWSEKEHREALKTVIRIATEHGVKGRGRCAREGLNCSLTGSAAGVRAFCEALRAWNPKFNETDFKLTDGIASNKGFKALTIRKTTELVAYGLAGDRAPSLQASSAQHLEAVDYHNMMTQPNTVIVDVRNAYESAIGKFAPPPGGAELIDPKLRNSHEFPKWLNAEETREKLNGKKVMMYCTGGIRCERASALLDALERSSTGDFKTDGVVMVRGGIERYMRTFPQGGFWKGKNYLFDRRFEQTPEKKSAAALKAEVESYCCVCSAPWDLYRGQFRCSGQLLAPARKCDVPVLVCDACQYAGLHYQKKLLCPLCTEGYLAPQALPSIVESTELDQADGGGVRAVSRHSRQRKRARSGDPSTRLFVGSLPFVVDVDVVRAAFALVGCKVEKVQWLRDTTSGLFYGSAFVQVDSLEAASRAVAASADTADGTKEKAVLVAGKRKLRVGYAPLRPGEKWPPEGYEQTYRPPPGY